MWAEDYVRFAHDASYRALRANDQCGGKNNVKACSSLLLSGH